MKQHRIYALCWFAIAAMLPSGAAAQAKGDCPPFGRMPNYEAQAQAQVRNYDAAEFRIGKSDGEETVTVAGRACRQQYTIKDGADVASDLEIQENYLSQVGKLGGEKLLVDGRHLYARVNRGGKEIWLHLYSQEDSIEVTVIEKQPFKPSLQAPSGADHRLFGHMPNYVGRAERRNFDKLSLRVQNGEETGEVEVRGARHTVTYEIKPNAAPASDLDIHSNYRHLVETLGGQVLYDDERNTSARLEQNGQTIWLKIYSQEDLIELDVIEEKPFQASIKTPEASAMKSALDKEGRVTLYVNFDFNKATLKPDAAPVLAQVVTLLKDNPGLTLEIGGHTDNIGSRDYNLKLSRQRADAIVAALVAQGIAAERLRAAGYGPDKPIADNDKEEGRAKNRRVELVKG
jgi:outer membrane protein OmpA-like peptidoglycan-associated protein